jgi:Leucine-rich repeat (LRR) protein
MKTYTSLDQIKGLELIDGSLDLRGTPIESLPENLSVGVDLDLSDTNIKSLPKNISVVRCLYLRGTPIRSLHENLCLVGHLDLRGTKIKSLPKNLSVGDDLDLRGTQIKALPANLTCGSLWFDGVLSGREFRIIDYIPSVVLSRENMGGYEVLKLTNPEFKSGELVKDKIFYAAVKDGESAHGETIKQAILDVRFKLSDRNPSQYKDTDIDEQMSIDDLVIMYRTITGACSLGVQNFIEESERKSTYSIREIIELTKNRYGHEELEEFFKGAI